MEALLAPVGGGSRQRSLHSKPARTVLDVGPSASGAKPSAPPLPRWGRGRVAGSSTSRALRGPRAGPRPGGGGGVRTRRGPVRGAGLRRGRLEFGMMFFPRSGDRLRRRKGRTFAPGGGSWPSPGTGGAEPSLFRCRSEVAAGFRPGPCRPGPDAAGALSGLQNAARTTGSSRRGGGSADVRATHVALPSTIGRGGLRGGADEVRPGGGAAAEAGADDATVPRECASGSRAAFAPSEAGRKVSLPAVVQCLFGKLAG